MTVADPSTLAERVLELAGGQAEAAVSVTRRRQGLTRFAASFIHQNVVDEHTEVSLQLFLAGRPASATTQRTDDRGLGELVEQALAAARLRPVDPAYPGLAPPAPLAAPPELHYDAATAEAGPAERAEIVAAFVAAGGGLEAAGFCETSLSERWFADSAGQRLWSRDTSASLDGIHRRAGADGVASTYSTRLAELDGAVLGAVAAERARLGADPVELPAGSYEVLLEPRCVAYLMEFFTFYGLNGRAVHEGRSFARPGEEQLDPALSLIDDATDRRQVGETFDVEGTPKRRLALVEAGVVAAVTHDRRSATRAGGGAASTGHALAGGEAFGGVATSTLLLPAAAGRPVGELLAGVERGLLVCDFWYTRVLDPKTLVATGLTRNGVFLVEHGEVGLAVGNLRFTQSYVAALAPGRVLGVGDDGRLAPGGLHFSLHHAPSLHLAGWSFTGNASA